MKNWMSVALALCVAGAIIGCKKDEAASGTTGGTPPATGGTTGMSSGSSATTAPGTTGQPATTTGGETAANVGKVAGEWEIVLPKEVMDEATKSGKPAPTGSMTVTADGKFTMSLSREDKTFKAEGNAKVNGSNLELTATLLDGKAPETESDKKPQVLKISDDGSTLTAEDGSGFTFKRKS